MSFDIDLFYRLFKASRVERCLYAVGTILLISALVGVFNFELFAMMLNASILYSIGGVINAKKDNDVEGLGDIRNVVLGLFMVAIFFSLTSYYVACATFIWFAFAFVYNYWSRKVLMLDGVVLSLTHVFIPGMFSLLVLEVFTLLNFFYVALLSFGFVGLVNVKNINQRDEDIARGYATLLTVFENGRLYTILGYCFALSVFTFVTGLVLHDGIYPLFLFALGVGFAMCAFSDCAGSVVKMMRTTWFSFIWIVLFDARVELFFSLASSGLVLLHLFFMRVELEAVMSEWMISFRSYWIYSIRRVFEIFE